MKKNIVIDDDKWEGSEFQAREKDQSIEIIYWEHDFVNKVYVISYIDKINESI